MATSVRSVRGVLYERDFAAWAEAQAEALRAGRLDALDEIWPNARIRAAVATRLPEDAFPNACPFTPDQLTGDWMP
jgi:hypothetical protein